MPVVLMELFGNAAHSPTPARSLRRTVQAFNSRRREPRSSAFQAGTQAPSALPAVAAAPPPCRPQSARRPAGGISRGGGSCWDRTNRTEGAGEGGRGPAHPPSVAAGRRRRASAAGGPASPARLPLLLLPPPLRIGCRLAQVWTVPKRDIQNLLQAGRRSVWNLAGTPYHT